MCSYNIDHKQCFNPTFRIVDGQHVALEHRESIVRDDRPIAHLKKNEIKFKIWWKVDAFLDDKRKWTLPLLRFPR